MIFLMFSEKMIFLFFRKYDLFFQGKTKDDLFQNKPKKICFFKYSENMVFPRKSHWNIILFYIIWKDGIFFSENIILFFRRKMKDDISQKTYK